MVRLCSLAAILVGLALPAQTEAQPSPEALATSGRMPRGESPTDDDDRPAPAVAAAPVRGEVPETTELPASAPIALEIAALSGRQCLRALLRADVPFERIRWARSGIVTPVIVTGAIGGVTIRAARNRVVHETMDCQLALALVHWARFLRARGVREVRHLSIHRPATRAELARRPMPARHPGALAIDVSTFVLDDGSVYEVARDFHGRLGTLVCGAGARVDPRPTSRFLRRLFCETARAGMFHVALSPNFNEEHHNHFHLEVTRSVSWLFVR